MNTQLQVPSALAVNDSDMEQGTVNDCVICLDAKNDIGLLCALSCGHTYHTKCADDYFKSLYISNHDITCPLCRIVLQRKRSTEYILSRMTILQQLPLLQQIPARNRNNRCCERILICTPILFIVVFIICVFVWTNVN
mgnify:CR=1 FL=1